MSDPIIADSSCLIALSKIGELFILKELFDIIIIPDAVYFEVVTCGKGRPGSEEIENADWIRRKSVKDEFAVKTLKLTLGAGESEAMVLASEINAAFLILDDRKAREIAQNLSLPVIGTAAIISKAAEKKIISDPKETFEKLKQAGFRFNLDLSGLLQ